MGYSIDDIKGIRPSFCMHKILLKDEHWPSRKPQYRLNWNMQEVVKKDVVKLLNTGIIYQISDSDWVSLRQVVPKKGEMNIVKNEWDELISTRTVTSWRMCIDYITLNDTIRKDHFSLPLDKFWNGWDNHSFFCYLDEYSEIIQIPIHSFDKEKTTFTCPYRIFAYRRMPFGLCNGPTTFQKCVLAIFFDNVEHIIEVFMDAFLAYGGTFDLC